MEETKHLLGGVRTFGIGVGPLGVAARPVVAELLDDPLLHDHAPFRVLVKVSDVVVALRNFFPRSIGRLIGYAVVVRAIVGVIVRLRPLLGRLMSVHDVDYRVFLPLNDDRWEDSCLPTGA